MMMLYVSEFFHYYRKVKNETLIMQINFIQLEWLNCYTYSIQVAIIYFAIIK